MNKKYIDAEETLNRLRDLCIDGNMWGNDESTLVDFVQVEETVSDIPAADVQEVKHGHWIFKEHTKLVPTNSVAINEGYSCVNGRNIDKAIVILKKRIKVKKPICSECKYHGDDKSDATPYCPNCGTKMDGEENENSKRN